MTEKTPSKTCLELTQGRLLISEVAIKAGRTKQVMSAMAKRFPEQFRLICLGVLYDLQQLENKKCK